MIIIENESQIDRLYNLKFNKEEIVKSKIGDMIHTSYEKINGKIRNISKIYNYHLYTIDMIDEDFDLIIGFPLDLDIEIVYGGFCSCGEPITVDARIWVISKEKTDTIMQNLRKNINSCSCTIRMDTEFSLIANITDAEWIKINEDIIYEMVDIFEEFTELTNEIPPKVDFARCSSIMPLTPKQLEEVKAKHTSSFDIEVDSDIINNIKSMVNAIETGDYVS